MPFSKQQTSYRSEVTQFLDSLKQANPQLEKQQRAGRALLWDRSPVSLDEQQRSKQSTVPISDLTYPTH